ncbi:PDZ domain-containing protein, partial [Mitsuokella multacida]
MSKYYPGIILRVYPGSLAEELELVPGDKILEINGQGLRDIIDLSFAMADEEIDMLVEHADGEQEMISFEKEIDEELGVEFESAVFDGIRNCANHCYF